MTTSDTLLSVLQTLYADYLARGCPCRFPRFRAVTKQWGIPSGMLSSEDRDRLIVLFEQHVPLVDRTGDAYEWDATCGLCGASIRAGSIESARGAWIAYLVVAKGVKADIGAPLEKPLRRCRSWRMTGDYGSFIAQASKVYRFVDEAEWLAWMRA